MREIFTYGSVGGAPGNRCFYPEADLVSRRLNLTFPMPDSSNVSCITLVVGYLLCFCKYQGP